MNRPTILLALACLLPMAATAATPPKTVRMPHGQYIDRAVRESADALPSGMTVRLVVTIDGATDTKGVNTADVQRWVVESLRAQLKKDSFSVLEAGADAEATHVLEVALVEFTPGSSGGRMFAGELGMGAAQLEVKGALKTAADETLLRFTDSRSHSGGMGIDDVGSGDIGPLLIKKLTAELAEDVSAEMHTMRTEAPKRRRR